MIDMQQIDNRRFMYNPKIGILVLGYQYATTSTLISSHANELADAVERGEKTNNTNAVKLDSEMKRCAKGPPD